MNENLEKNLKFERYFTRDLNGKSVYEDFEWDKEDIAITDDFGKTIFVQENAEFPKKWSSLARKIVGSKYFFGENETSEREYSAGQLIGRVSETFGEWALKQNYFSPEKTEEFKDELAYLSLSQKMAFNSPVWFNVGIDKRTKRTNHDRKEEYIVEDGKVILVSVGDERKYPQTSACFIQSVEDRKSVV